MFVELPCLQASQHSPVPRTLDGVSITQPETELVVAADGSIPAAQLARVGLRPGTHLRVVTADAEPDDSTSVEGSLPNLPDLDWAAFERGSELAQQDLADA